MPHSAGNADSYFYPALKTAEVKLDVYLNNQMSLHPPDKLVTRQEDEGMVSLDGGATVARLSDHLVARYL
ncbi:hypothetical protein GCM10023149_29310 [Mucilaginibacter gynuensis]|uniref:Uncharacterized protein n=1 Tax=Mucilaginibacter gynuensis TaxID=1302236 RepID=A0ABP8GLA8_9SPHI